MAIGFSGTGWFSFGQRIVNGLSWICGPGVLLGLDVLRFSLDLGSMVSLDLDVLGFRGSWIDGSSGRLDRLVSFLGFGGSGFSGSLDRGFSDIDRVLLCGLDCFRLLKQRCKTLLKKGNLLDEGVLLPDESPCFPTKERHSGMRT